MPDATTTIANLRDAWRQFIAERDWEQFHSPKNLAMGLAVEAAELMEHFLWVENEESRSVARDPARLAEVADELADVAGFLFCLCNTLGVDLSDAVAAKMTKNAQKYPAERFKGRYRAEE
jgi:NTP pyrophosphatase (non-canonical NTP hydrolase)